MEKRKDTHFVNDRLYLYNSSGYLMLGHSEPTNRPSSTDQKEDAEDDKEKKNTDLHKVILGDDLGSDSLLYTGARLDFCNMTYLKEYNARLYSSAEAAYYPSFNKPSKSPISDVRGSIGFGVNLQLNDMINIALHYNAANFNTKIGDIER